MSYDYYKESIDWNKTSTSTVFSPLEGHIFAQPHLPHCNLLLVSLISFSALMYLYQMYQPHSNWNLSVLFVSGSFVIFFFSVFFLVDSPTVFFWDVWDTASSFALVPAMTFLMELLISCTLFLLTFVDDPLELLPMLCNFNLFCSWAIFRDLFHRESHWFTHSIVYRGVQGIYTFIYLRWSASSW